MIVSAISAARVMRGIILQTLFLRLYLNTACKSEKAETMAALSSLKISG